MGIATGLMFGLTAASAALQARSASKAAKAQQQAGAAAVDAGLAEQRAHEAAALVSEDRAAQFDYNAAIAELQAKDVIERGREDESRFRVGVRGLIGSQRAGFAGQGVDVGFGSAVDVQSDARSLGQADIQTMRKNAEREAWGFKVQAEDLARGGGIARKEAEAAREAGRAAAQGGRVNQQIANTQASAMRWNAGATVLGTGASLVMSKYGWGKGKAA